MLRDFVILFLGGLSTFLDLIFLVGKFVGFVFGNFGVFNFLWEKFLCCKVKFENYRATIENGVQQQQHMLMWLPILFFLPVISILSQQPRY